MATPAPFKSSIRWWQRPLQWIIILLTPYILVVGSARLLMTETYLHWEYQRDGFPADLYGWETQTRLDYGFYGIAYLLNDEDISYLGDLVIDGETFTERELHHMEDVQVVTRNAMQGLTASLLLWGLASVLLWRSSSIVWWRTIMQSGRFTLVLASGLVLLALVSWDFFFDGFHALFFEDGTWQFYRSDTLIRLYPPQFWFDSAIIAGGLTLLGAALFSVVPYVVLYRHKHHESLNT